MKKGSWFFLGFGAVIFVTAIFLYNRHLEKPRTTQPVAFLNAHWGMNRRQVERANQKRLHPVASQRKFYNVKPGVKERSRYQALEESSSRQVLGYDATITYLFFDGKLFAYYVFIQDRDTVLDQDMRKYLIDQFGGNYATSEEAQSPKMVWSRKDVFVNYWFFQDELSLSGKYTAGYGVVYRPLEEAARS